MLEEAVFATLRDIGRDIFLRGLISSHAGNASVRLGRTIYITRRGSMLGRLRETDMIDVDLEKNDSRTLLASSELEAHRSIYKNTGAGAVIHAHPPYATLLSMTSEELVPTDYEGAFVIEKVPVITCEKSLGSQKAATVIGELLREYKILLMRAHGSFARGDTAEEAYMLTSSLEASSFYLHHLSVSKDAPSSRRE